MTPSHPKTNLHMANQDFVCCGQHAVCERESLLASAAEAAEYFDDEELDRFRGRRADAYTPAEEEEFREVLYTMFPREVEDWTHSLDLRGIALPASVQDEVLLILTEQRFGG